MTAANLPTDNVIEQVHQALANALISFLSPMYAGITIDIYPKAGRFVSLPAVMIDCESMDAPILESDGSLSIPATFGIYCIVDRAQDHAAWHVRELCAQTMRALHDLFLVPGHGKLTLLGANEDNMRPELDSYRVWRVDLMCPIRVAGQVINPPTPTQVYISWAEFDENGPPDTILDGPHLVTN